MRQTEELTNERLLRSAEQRHVRTILPAAQNGGERNDKDFEKVVTSAVFARIFQAVEGGGKLLREGLRCRVQWFESILHRAASRQILDECHMRFACLRQDRGLTGRESA